MSNSVYGYWGGLVLLIAGVVALVISFVSDGGVGSNSGPLLVGILFLVLGLAIYLAARNWVKAVS